MVNVASGVSVPVETLVDYLCARLGCSAERQFLARPDDQRVRIDKLRRLVGDLDPFGFGPEYYRRVIDRYYDACVLAGTTTAP